MTQTQHTALAEAIQQLTTYQRQLDEHGTEVGVSRQALDEVLQAVAAAPELLEAAQSAIALLTYEGEDATGFAAKVEADLRAAISKATGAS